MDLSPLLPLAQGLEIASISVCHDGVVVQVVATALYSLCPLCKESATRVHSQYTRRVADLPCAGQPVQLILRVRKFFCDTPDCPRKIFTERLMPFLAPWARMSGRLSQVVQAIGLATCGKLGARLSIRLGIHVSWMTVLHRIMAPPSLSCLPVSKLGIDDFALRRGRTYGTILIDLERHQVIDLLPDRQAETSAVWLEQHPTIELVSRDRGGDYAAAARKGAPQAIQVADRFHLLHNLTQAVGEALMRCWAEHRPKRQRRPSLGSAKDNDSPNVPPDGARRFSRSRTQERAYQARQAARAEEYAQMVALRAQGMSFKAIARQVGKGGTTVWAWLTQGSTPTGIHQAERPSELDAYIPYLLTRYQEGCHYGLQLWREITAHGYGGSAHMVYDFLAALRHSTHAPVEGLSKETPKDPGCTVREALWLLMRDHADLSPAEQEALTTLQHLFPMVEELSRLVQAFRQMLHQRAGDSLDDWVKQARASRIPEVRRFAVNLEKDQAAVVAGITVRESNGPTEGHITKLKLIKRTMYGRASFPLLRQRVLHAL